jgi:hypothetical protein
LVTASHTSVKGLPRTSNVRQAHSLAQTGDEVSPYRIPVPLGPTFNLCYFVNLF